MSDIVFLGYKERPSLSTTGVRRREWRITTHTPGRCALQERQVCTGASYPGVTRNEFDWRTFCEGTFATCVSLLPHDIVPCHSAAVAHVDRCKRVQEEREAKAAEREAKAAEREAKRLHDESAAAFRRLAESKRETWASLAREWNATLSSRGDELRETLQREPETLALYRDVMNATTVPDKARTIRAFLTKVG